MHQPAQRKAASRGWSQGAEVNRKRIQKCPLKRTHKGTHAEGDYTISVHAHLLGRLPEGAVLSQQDALYFLSLNVRILDRGSLTNG